MWGHMASLAIFLIPREGLLQMVSVPFLFLALVPAQGAWASPEQPGERVLTRSWGLLSRPIAREADHSS